MKKIRVLLLFVIGIMGLSNDIFAAARRAKAPGSPLSQYEKNQRFLECIKTIRRLAIADRFDKEALKAAIRKLIWVVYQGASKNSSDQNGNTALHLLCFADYVYDIPPASRIRGFIVGEKGSGLIYKVFEQSSGPKLSYEHQFLYNILPRFVRYVPIANFLESALKNFDIDDKITNIKTDDAYTGLTAKEFFWDKIFAEFDPLPHVHFGDPVQPEAVRLGSAIEKEEKNFLRSSFREELENLSNGAVLLDAIKDVSVLRVRQCLQNATIDTTIKEDIVVDIQNQITKYQAVLNKLRTAEGE